MNTSDLSLISTISIASAKQSATNRSGEIDQQLAAKDAQATEKAAATTGTPESNDLVQLSDKAKAIVRSLQARDQQVRAHEQAHLASSGGLATSGASYTYQKGPDGVSYAIGGEVSIDISTGRTPEETIARAITIRAAALAPADPSGQDRAVAAAASQLEQQARGELLSKASEELQAKLKSAYEGNSENSKARINELA